MIKKIKIRLVTILALVTLITPGVVGVASVSAKTTAPAAPAGCAGITDNLTAGANSTDSGVSTECTKNSGATVNEGSFTTIARNVVNVLSLVIGAISVIMIIFGGFRYVTSAGAAEKVASAKNTIIYALVGLVIVALAQTMVHFVLNKATSVISG